MNEPETPVTPEKNWVDKAIDECSETIRIQEKRREWLAKNRDRLKDLPRGNFACGMLDFDHLPHADVVKVVRAIGGKWDKKPATDNTINYEAKSTLDGVAVRCWQGKPPPSCKIVEVDEVVPEQVIPAHTKKVRKMVCLPEVGAVIAVAREKGQASLAANSEVPF